MKVQQSEESLILKWIKEINAPIEIKVIDNPPELNKFIVFEQESELSEHKQEKMTKRIPKKKKSTVDYKKKK